VLTGAHAERHTPCCMACMCKLCASKVSQFRSGSPTCISICPTCKSRRRRVKLRHQKLGCTCHAMACKQTAANLGLGLQCRVPVALAGRIMQHTPHTPHTHTSLVHGQTWWGCSAIPRQLGCCYTMAKHLVSPLCPSPQRQSLQPQGPNSLCTSAKRRSRQQS
jgi:hypothetical protein